MRREYWTCLSCSLILFGAMPQPASGSNSAGASRQAVDPRLKSAYLLRENLVGWAGTEPTVTAIRTALQSHFDAVLERLTSQEKSSIELALTRLETYRGKTWSSSQREFWRSELTRYRRLNVDRLARYRDRGLFPQNEGHADFSVPIFVDRHDTACAVGHLMRESGWVGEVAWIANVDLMVYAPDAYSGPLIRWAMYSGLTLEEAALIQPAYPPPNQHFFTELMANGSLEVDGIRIENFQWIPGPGHPQAGFSMSLQKGAYSPFGFGGISLKPTQTHLAYVGLGITRTNDGLFNSGGVQNGTAYNYLQLQFDAVAVDPMTRLSGAGVSMQGNFFNPGYAYGDDPAGGLGVFSFVETVPNSTSLAFPGLGVGHPAMAQPIPILGNQLIGSDVRLFSPQSRVRFRTLIAMEGVSRLDSFNLELNLITVPEPPGIALVATFFPIAFLLSRRRSRMN